MTMPAIARPDSDGVVLWLESLPCWGLPVDAGDELLALLDVREEVDDVLDVLDVLDMLDVLGFEDVMVEGVLLLLVEDDVACEVIGVDLMPNGSIWT